MSESRTRSPHYESWAVGRKAETPKAGTVAPPEREGRSEGRSEPSVAVKRHALFVHLRQKHGMSEEEVSTWYGKTFDEAQADHVAIRPHPQH